jgi:hypothetical protein
LTIGHRLFQGLEEELTHLRGKRLPKDKAWILQYCGRQVWSEKFKRLGDLISESGDEEPVIVAVDFPPGKKEGGCEFPIFLAYFRDRLGDCSFPYACGPMEP